MAALALGWAMTGCSGTPPAPPVAPDLVSAAIETAADGRCYGRDISPAVIETVTVQEVETPAVRGPDGAVLSPAVYRTITRPQIVRERSEQAFETVCPPAYTAAFVESLQRALTVRGYYRGPVTGILDTATARAVQDFQRTAGPDSPLLSMAAARDLGLVALTREQIDAL